MKTDDMRVGHQVWRTISDPHVDRFDTAWRGNQRTDAWKQLAMTQARLAYLAKWQGQVRETLLALM